jgi:Helix-turn-helix domain
MPDDHGIAAGWRMLGRQLAACRQAAGLTQQGLAKLICYTRSTVANVETGRQIPGQDFWLRCDAILDGRGELRGAYEALSQRRRRLRQADHGSYAALHATAPAGSRPMPGSRASGRSDTTPPGPPDSGAGEGSGPAMYADSRPDGSCVGWGHVDHGVGSYQRESDEMNRRTILAAGLALPVAQLPAGPGRVETVELDSVRRSLRTLYHDIASPERLLDLVGAQLDHSATLTARAHTDAGRRPVLQARSELGTLAGRLAFFDLRRPTLARGYYLLAYEAAQYATDHALACAAAGHLAFIPGHEGQAVTAAAYLDVAAQHAAQADSPLLSSWVHAVRSELLAVTDPAGSLRALDRAATAITHHDPDTTPEWLDYYSSERLDGFAGYALLKAGESERARTALGRAMDRLPGAAVKQKAVFQLDVAATYLHGPDPDPDTTAELGAAAVDALTTSGYATGTERLTALRAELRPWRDRPAVRAFEQHTMDLAA